MKNLKRLLLDINNIYLMFGTTMYVGVLWALRFFWYPSWNVMTVDNVQDHFINPTANATKFFWVVVPLMLIANIIFIVSEWKTKYKWIGLIVLACTVGASYYGQALIIPINDQIATGNVTDQAELTALLQDWMRYNNARWIIMTIQWLAMMYFFVSKRNTGSS